MIEFKTFEEFYDYFKSYTKKEFMKLVWGRFLRRR